MKIRVVVAIVLLAAMAGCASNQHRDVLDQSRAAALRLEMNDAGVCSGTAIGPHLILSATHCFEGLTKLTVNGKEVVVRKQVDDGNDHTMLVVDITFKMWASVGVAPKPGDVVFLWGQPAFLNFMYRVGHVAGYDEDEGKTTTVYDVNGFFGDSGSGIFNEAGEVVAVTSYCLAKEYQGVQFKLMGSIPIAFTPFQYAEVGYAAR